MKKSTFKVQLVLTICLCMSFSLFGQTPDQKRAIAETYDQELLAQLALEYSRTFKEDFEAAKAYAAVNNIPVFIERENGGIAVLHKVLADGSLLYTSTTNQGAARTVGANKLYPGPSPLDLEVEGEGIVLGIWDGGLVLPTHEMLGGRVQQIDGATGLSNHATHVSGTMIGSGIPDSAAKGMAPKATLLANDFDNAMGEMTPQAAAGLILSNHSYGIPAGNVTIPFLGSYTNGARSLDQLLYNTPYYMPVYSAGNDRNSGVNTSDNGYDLLTGDKNAKNNIVVAAVNTVNNYTGPASVVMSNFSSWGPSDDGRVKPDISAKGVNTYSSLANNNDSYGSMSGTSMAAPSVTGTLALLQELYSDIHGNFMKSATLKGLVIQTALEAGTDPGPDARFGWGLLNAEAAAQALLDEDFESLVYENSLANSGTYTKTVTSNGVDPLIVTIAWTDPPGNASGAEDDTTPRLVNDLDLVLEDQGGNLFYPWRLIPGLNSSPAIRFTTNDTDNVEKVEVDVPSGDYIIRVTHQGNLLNGMQDYSLIATGISESDFTYTPDNIRKESCADQVALFEFNYESSDTYIGPTTLSVSGLPAGAVATFTPSVITTDEDFILEISNLNSIGAGIFPFTVIASGSSLIKETDMELEVIGADPLTNPVLDYPNNGETEVFIFPTLNWDTVANALEYLVEVSSTSDFSTIVFETTTTETNVGVPGLDSNIVYFWRVKPLSECVEGNFTDASFTTESVSCSNVVTAQDTPLAISLIPNEIQSVITIPAADDVLIGDINVTVNLNHTWLGDLTISLISPSGTEVILMDGVCGEANNIDVIFDDSGIVFECADDTPAVTGILKGQNLLTPFIAENSVGNWTLRVVDGFNDDGGALNNFAIEFCSTAGPLSIADNKLEGFELFPNPAKDYFEFTLQNQFSNVKLGIYDINGRALISKSFNSQDRKIVDTTSLSAGIYFVEINSGNQIGVKKLIIK
ncbi:S8 family serine peptidase [Psychroserpens jangbogonensis]|uniref:S8 family serine peptidase n=1 Tax=Psychroserpens jangbogonensis TaxID=1484460 RepID=UPI0009DDE068|nr:S8 family serine peptidase [Psychroserpens jangbogonensis]